MMVSFRRSPGSGHSSRVMLERNVSFQDHFLITSSSRPCFASLLALICVSWPPYMLVLAAAPPHYIFLPISLNSLDREGVRLLSPCDSHITSKTRWRCRWYHSKRCDWTQVEVQRGFETLLCFLSGWSVEEPSWGDRGSFALGVVFFFRSRTLIVSGWCNAIFMYCVKWRL